MFTIFEVLRNNKKLSDKLQQTWNQERDILMILIFFFVISRDYVLEVS